MPPSALRLHILLALAKQDGYGAALHEQVVMDSRSTLIPPENTFYRTLHDLERKGLVSGLVVGGRRRIYALTMSGCRVLKIERARIYEMAALLRQRLD